MGKYLKNQWENINSLLPLYRTKANHKMYKLTHNGLTTIGKMSEIHNLIRAIWGTEVTLVATDSYCFRHSVIHKVTRSELATIEMMPDLDNMTYVLREKVKECVN